MVINAFSTPMVVHITGISERQLNHWDRLGLVSPSLEPARGSGSRRRYAAEDLFFLLLVGRLREAHVPLERVADAVSAARAQKVGLQCPSDVRMVLPMRGVIYLGSDPQEIKNALESEPVALLVDVGQLAGEARALAAMPAAPQTCTVDLGARVRQAVVTREEAGFSVHCNAYPGFRGHGATVDEAIAALRAAIESAPRAARTAAPAGTATRRASPTPRASAWGGEW